MDIKYVNKKNKIELLPTGNREIRPNHVTKIANSVRKHGVLRPIIVVHTTLITGKPGYYVVDGQHLMYALLRLNLPIPFVVYKGKIETWTEIIHLIADLNTSSKQWSMLNYIDAWSVIKKDYRVLNTFLNKYDFENRFTACVLHQGQSHTGASSYIKNGTFTVKNLELADSLLKDLTEVFEAIKMRGNRWEIQYFCMEYYKFRMEIKKYNHKKFLTKIAKTAELYTFLDGKEEKLKNFFISLIS